MDAEAFERALRPHLRRAGGYALSLLHDRKDAEDAVQQAALQGWSRRDQYDGERPFKAWWFGILRNHCLDRLRGRARAPQQAEADHPEASTAADESVLDRRALAAAMARLPEGQREVLRLRYFADLSYEECAEVLQIPRGTVMSRLHLARKAMAALLAAEDV